MGDLGKWGIWENEGFGIKGRMRDLEEWGFKKMRD